MTLEEKVENLASRLEKIKEEILNAYIETMPPTWRTAVLACVAAAKAKSSKGRRYTSQWIYECQLLRIKSLGLYKKMLRDNFLPLPSLRTLQRYMRKLKPAYGFQENTFTMLKEKSSLLPEATRHGKCKMYFKNSLLLQIFPINLKKKNYQNYLFLCCRCSSF